MKRDIRVYVQDILDSIAKIAEYTKAVTKDDFRKNTQLQDAVLRRLEIIGEAVKNIPEQVRDKYPQVRWKNIAVAKCKAAHISPTPGSFGSAGSPTCFFSPSNSPIVSRALDSLSSEATTLLTKSHHRPIYDMLAC